MQRFGAYGLLGWGAGYAVFREVGPILIGLMFSGRVGANNTAELGTMTVTEQIDGLRALAIDPLPYLIVPRVLAMMLSLFCLLILVNTGARPLVGWFSIWQWFVMSVIGAVFTPVWFWLFDVTGRVLNYRPVGEAGFRHEREIKRGRQ